MSSQTVAANPIDAYISKDECLLSEGDAAVGLAVVVAGTLSLSMQAHTEAKTAPGKTEAGATAAASPAPPGQERSEKACSLMESTMTTNQTAEAIESVAEPWATARPGEFVGEMALLPQSFLP